MYRKVLVNDAEWRYRNKYWDKYDTLLFCQLLVLLYYSELNVRRGKTSTDLFPEVSFGPWFKLGPQVCLLFG